jgi:hypothetical protein
VEGRGGGPIYGAVSPFGRAQENNEDPQSGKRFPGRDLNAGPPEYESGELPTRPPCSDFQY